MNSFFDDLKRGASGEEAVKKWLINRGNKVDDVRDNREYQQQDIDFVVNDINCIEVKTDYRISQTNNVCIELSNQRFRGWYDYCKADFLFIYDKNSDALHVVYMKLFREYIDKYGFDKTVTTREGKSLGLISIDTLAQHDEFYVNAGKVTSE